MSSAPKFRALFRMLSAAIVVGAPLLWAADRPSARLSFVKKPGATVCPEEPSFRALVAARLGYDPFRDDAERAVDVTFVREGKGFRAKLELHDKAGKVVGTRVLSASECSELASSTALAVAIAIDPLGGSGASSGASSGSSAPSASTPSSSPVPEVEVPPPPAASSAPAPATFPTLALGGLAVFGAAPQFTFGLTAGVGVRAPDWSVGIEGRVDDERSKRGPEGGSVSASVLSGALVPCLHHDVLMGCAVLAYGSLRGAGTGVSEAREDRTPWGAAGVRLGIEVTLLGPFLLRAHLDGLATLTRTTLRVQGVDAWRTPPLQVLSGLTLVGRFR